MLSWIFGTVTRVEKAPATTLAEPAQDSPVTLPCASMADAWAIVEQWAERQRDLAVETERRCSYPDYRGQGHARIGAAQELLSFIRKKHAEARGYIP